MRAVTQKNACKPTGTDPVAAKKTDKVLLKATKVVVRKAGMNAGITGGRYQCC